MKTNAITTADYLSFVADLKSRITSARISVARAVNRELILLYWDLGKAILEQQEKQGWGEAVIDRLSRDLLSAFPGVSGFSPRNLRNMKQFYSAYTAPAFWQQLVAKLGVSPQGEPVEILKQSVLEIPWGHHLLILNKISEPQARLYYLQATAHLGWSRNVLLNQIKAGAYERTLAEGKTHNFPVVLPEYLAEQAEEMLKSSYNLEFLGIQHEVKERELETRLIEQIQRFILELGYGFCFIGRQHRITLGNKDYFIDLLFYHRFLKALVAMELKVGPFEPEYAGKMDFYLNLLNEKERGPEDHPSIGIILCAEKEALEVEFALKSKANPIGVAEYQLRPTLPKELQGKLPSAKQLSEALQLPPVKKKR